MMRVSLFALTELLAQSYIELDPELVGDAEHFVSNVSSITSADCNCVTFFVDNALRAALGKCEAGVVILTRDDMNAFAGNRIVVSDPLLAFSVIASQFRNAERDRVVVDKGSNIHPEALIGHNVSIGPGAVVGKASRIGDGVTISSNASVGSQCTVGNDTKIDANVVIYDNCHIGARCRLNAGVVIGATGFGYVPHNQVWIAVPQIAGVRIGDDVDIGANSTIDCGTLDDTVIENGVKIDNQVQIGHNCSIGEHSIIAGCTGVSGSVTIGRRCMLGGRVSVKDHVVIADDVVIEGTTFVSKSIAKSGRYSSIITAQSASRWKKNAARLHRLDDLSRRLLQLERQFAVKDDSSTN